MNPRCILIDPADPDGKTQEEVLRQLVHIREKLDALIITPEKLEGFVCLLSVKDDDAEQPPTHSINVLGPVWTLKRLLFTLATAPGLGSVLFASQEQEQEQEPSAGDTDGDADKQLNLPIIH